MYNLIYVVSRGFAQEFVKDFHKGPFIYYVIKKVGGWVWPNAYVFLQGGWVGLAKCLRNQKNEFTSMSQLEKYI